MMSYKWCIVSHCKNTSIKSPDKVFISVPKNPATRKLWAELAGRSHDSFKPSSNVFMCEDHFDMENDTKNYRQYKMKLSQRILLNDNAVPSKLLCEEDLKRHLSDTIEPNVKKQKLDDIQQSEDDIQQSEDDFQTQINTVQKTMEIEPIEMLKISCDKGTNTEIVKTSEKSVQASRKAILHYRSKSIQTKNYSTSISTSPFQVTTTSRFTSPLSKTSCMIVNDLSSPSTSGFVKARKNIFPSQEKSDSDSCLADTNVCSVISSLTTTSSSKLDSDSTVIDETHENILRIKSTIHIISKKPLMYIGVPKDCFFLINLVHKHTNIKIEYILLCLKKIRLNSTFSELEDNFGISLSYASKLFLKNIPIIASVLQPFIVKLDKNLIKKNIPIAFRQNYSNVSCIIDCLEIDIQKPSKALHQALTWSEYKKGNTIKYLISCTPNGLVNYISPGFGGRVSDVTLVENCSFLDGLEPATTILADRGFKHIEQLLNQKGIKLLRPPSVSAGSKLSKDQVRQTKVIASLRIHVERVIRRIREFHMLKQHAVINSNLLRVLDNVVIIACALINLQDSLIK